MIIANLYGGLGNQLFQYAAAYSLSKEKNKLCGYTDYINSFYKETHSNFDLGSLYRLPSKKVNSLELKNKIGFISTNYYLLKINQKYLIKLPNVLVDKKLSLLSNNKNCLLNGYFQDIKFFHKYQREIINIYNYPSNLNLLSNDPVFSNIKNENSISIHIRGNDYLKDKKRLICNLSYYQNAIRVVKNSISNPSFYLFTDDVKYSMNLMKNLNIDFTLVSNLYGSSLNLYLMSKCKHNIISNSTYSWWAAFLNQNITKTVIAPQKWISNSDITPNINSWHQI